MGPTPLSLPATPAVDQRAARLEARLSIYAQYATLLGAEMQAAWSAEPEEAAERTRQLARARADLADRYHELREWPEDTPVTPESFGGMLSDAVIEMDQQRLLDQALRAQAGQLGPGALLAAGAPHLLTAGTMEVEPAFEVVGDDETARSTHSDDSAATAMTPSASSTETTHEDGTAAFGGALVAARSSGLGGMLGGQYPGVVAGMGTRGRIGSTSSEDAPSGSRARLDVRF